MEADIAFSHVKVALNQRQNGALAGAGRPANPQHLPGLERKVDLFQRDLVRLRVDKLAHGDAKRTAPFRRRLAAVVHHRRLLQHGANARIGRATALHDVKHPRQRQHWPDHQAEVHHKAGELTQSQAALDHHPAAAADGQQVSGPDSDINRRVKAGVDTRHAHVFRPGIRGVGGKQRRLSVFETKGFDHADAGQALLGAVVEAGEGRLRDAKAFV